MKQKIFYCTLIAICSLTAFSQTTTITYTNANLGSNCNIFNPGISVGGLTHQSRAGGVSYLGGAGNGLSLASIPSGPSNGGTAFVISYSFTAGYDYTVAITARGDNVMYLKATVVPNLNQFNTTSTGSCTPDANVISYSNVGTGNISAQPGPTNTTYTSSSFAGSGQPYLVVWAYWGPSNLSLDALVISSIVITKTATTPSFTLPSTTNISCGSTSPVTFTVTNANNTPNVTNYTWHLGATPNGWLYNGNPAPQTVSTSTTNNITLTPSCGASLSNISATVTAGGNNYNTNTSTTAITAPSLSISGNSSFCSNSVYTLANVPCKASVSWSASPTGVVSISGSGSQVTVTRLYNTTFNLTATVTACGNTYTTTKSSITAGEDLNGTYSTSYDGGGPLVKYPQEGYNYINEYSWVWAYVGNSATWSYIDGTISSWSVSGYLQFYLAPGDYAVFRATATVNGCTTSQDYTFVAQPNYYSYYSLAPNPASSDLTIYVDDEKLRNQKIPKSSDQVIQQVVIMDKLGNVLLQEKYPADSKKATLNVRNLSPDMYVAKIFDGKKWTSIKFFKK